VPLTLELYHVVADGAPKPSAEIKTSHWLSRAEFEQNRYNLAPSFAFFVPDLIRHQLF
jgi:hypothetical protein